MKRLIDTNVLVDETLEDSDRHEEACRLVDSSPGAALTRTVLLEYIWVMLKKIGAPAEFVSKKVEEYYLKFTPYCERLSDIKLALSIMSKERFPPRLFNDLLILAYAKNNGLELITFDEELSRLAGKMGVRCIP